MADSQNVNRRRIMSTRRVVDQSASPDPRAHAHAIVTSIASNSVPVVTTGSDTPDTGNYQLDLLVPREGDREEIGRCRKEREEQKSRCDKLAVPPELAEFDAILSKSNRYRPTAKFYERVVAYFVGVPGLDLAYEADGLMHWLISTPKGRARTDIARTAENWLANAKERALRMNRGTNAQRGYGNGYNTGTRPYGVGHATAEDRESARRIAQKAEQDD